MEEFVETDVTQEKTLQIDQAQGTAVHG